MQIWAGVAFGIGRSVGAGTIMFGLQLNTFDVDESSDNEAALAFRRSYLLMRLAIGSLGVALPVLLVVVDWLFIDAQRPIRGSMSAYYHSSARDVFVGGLVSTGIFLVSYMAVKKRTYDYVLSSVCGVLVIIVALLPTARSGIDLGVDNFNASDTSCGEHPGPPLCNGFQQEWGEGVVRNIHQISACSFVVLLAVLCVVFALREFGYGPGAKALVGDQRSVRAVRDALKSRHVSVVTYIWQGLPPRTRPDHPAAPPRRRVLSYLLAASAIVISALWAVVGPDVHLPFVDGKVGSAYVGEFGAFVAFGCAWLTASWDLMPRPLQVVGDGIAGAVDSMSGAKSAE